MTARPGSLPPNGANNGRTAPPLAYVRRDLLLYRYGPLTRPDPVNIKPAVHPQADPKSFLSQIPTLQLWAELGPYGSPQLPWEFYHTSLWLEFAQANCILLPGWPHGRRKFGTEQNPYGFLPPSTENCIAELLNRADPPDLIGLHDPELNQVYAWLAAPASHYRVIRAARRSGPHFLELPLGLPADDPSLKPSPWVAEQQTALVLRELRAAEGGIARLQEELAALNLPPPPRPPDPRRERSQRQTRGAELRHQLQSAARERDLLLRELEYWPARLAAPENPVPLADLIRARFLPEHAVQVHGNGLLGLLARERLAAGNEMDPGRWAERMDEAAAARRRRAYWQYEYRRLQTRARELNPKHQEVPPIPVPTTPKQQSSVPPRRRVKVPPDCRQALAEPLRQQAEWEQAKASGATPANLIHLITHRIRPALTWAQGQAIMARSDVRRLVESHKKQQNYAGCAEGQRTLRQLRKREALLRQFAEYWDTRLAECRERIRAEHAAHDGSWPPPPPIPLAFPTKPADNPGMEYWRQAGLKFIPDPLLPGSFLVLDAAGSLSLGRIERYKELNKTWHYIFHTPQGGQPILESHADLKQMTDCLLRQTEQVNKEAALSSLLYNAAPPYPALNPETEAEREARREPADYAVATMEKLNLTLTPMPPEQSTAPTRRPILLLKEKSSGEPRWRLEQDSLELWHAVSPGGMKEGTSLTFAGILDHALTRELERELSRRPATRPPREFRLMTSPPEQMPEHIIPPAPPLPALTATISGSPSTPPPARQLALLS